MGFVSSWARAGSAGLQGPAAAAVDSRAEASLRCFLGDGANRRM